MNLQQSINLNTLLAYQPTETIEPQRKIKSEEFDWYINNPKSLAHQCVEKIAENWIGSPKLEELVPKDRELLLNILDTNIPLQLLVDNIKSDIFWKKCYSSKWNDLSVHMDGKRWINVFMERYYADFLENLNPREYDPEKVSKLVKLCGPYTQSLSIRSLIPCDIPVQRIVSPEMIGLITSQEDQSDSMIAKVKNTEPLNRDHISLHAALGSLSNLVELHITYQLRSTGVAYRRDQFQFTESDAKNLARGLEKCSHLKVFRITRTDMDCQKVKFVLRGLSENQILETLDVSHCKIGNDGIYSIAKFISKHENLRNLVLVDNVFGPLGIESISNTLNQNGCGIRDLNLRLNCKLGSEGVAHVAVAIARGCNLISLNISGCGIKPNPLSKSTAGIWSATTAESPPTCGDLLARAIGLARTPLRSLDISVNNIGSPSDLALSNAICLSNLLDINLKRSGMSSMAMAIGESAVAAQRLRREAEKGKRFRQSASRVLQAKRVARGMNIDADPILLAQQLSARPSIVSVASEEGAYFVQTQPLPTDFGFIPALKSPIPSSRNSSITGPPTSRRSSHHVILETDQEIRKSALVRRGSDGLLLQPRSASHPRHIKIFISKELGD